ncbi:adhesin [Escherichia coli]|nr:adhesin [Escherichia coli]
MNGSIRKMMRVTCGMLLMVMSGVSQSAELTLESHGSRGGQLRDGEKLATGRIICREAHTGFHVWMNERQVDGRAERYVVQSKDGRHELRVRTGGDGWSPVKGEGGKGVSRPGQEEQFFFDVMADGNQDIAPGEYRFSVGGACVVPQE